MRRSSRQRRASIGVIASATAAFLGICLWSGDVWGQEFDVWIESPEPGVPVFGEVEIVVDVLGLEDADIAEVQFFVDHQAVTVLSRPPWRWIQDVGEQNVSRRFEVVAVANDGRTASALLESPTIRVDEEVDLDLRQLYVTVTQPDDQGGERRIRDLPRDKFTVRDLGLRQQIVTFEGGDVPITVLVLVDSSKSMRGDRLRTALEGADQLFRRLGPLDRAKLLLFADRVVHQTPFTSFPDVLRAGLRGVQSGGGSAVADHLYLALHQLEQQQGRRVIVLLSDGVNSFSFLRMDEVLELSRRSRSLIYWMRLGPSREKNRIYTAWRGEKEHRQELKQLAEMVEETGGRVVPLQSMADIGAAFDTVMDELREQYVLGYYPSRRRGSGAWHDVEVDVDMPRVDVRARTGYVEE
ncbi:MAG: VWA domain-containing protein [Thermoanaerobaculia bacterium]|nr:VWA domain-containing protein [Thermoanaerobaculia bacterium]